MVVMAYRDYRYYLGRKKVSQSSLVPDVEIKNSIEVADYKRHCYLYRGQPFHPDIVNNAEKSCKTVDCSHGIQKDFQ